MRSSGNKNKFYEKSLSYLDCCVISAVGKNSLHHEWTEGQPKFDLHLIVYDDSYEKFKLHTSYITAAKGYKFKLIYKYLSKNKYLIDKYDFFYIPDDDVSIDTKNIHKLFRYMKKYELAIAQPAVSNPFISHPHTLRQPNSLLRYTNFVEIMQPCFSKEALKKTLFTFNENKSGWGIDFHWGKLMNYKQLNMAIIDDIVSYHTRPVQSSHRKDLEKYIHKYNLDCNVYVAPSVKPDINDI